MDMIQVVRRLKLFEGLDDETLTAIARDARLMDAEAGQVFFQQGDISRSLHVLIRGEVKLFKCNQDGKEQTLYFVDTGEPFCLCSLYCEEPMPVSATAVTRGRILTISADTLRACADRAPRLLMNVLRVLNQRLTSSMSLIEDLTLKDIHQRMASFLKYSTGKEGQAGTFRLRVPKREIAKILGTTPETVSRVLGKMAREGLIQVNNREITILDTVGLEQSLED